MLKLDALSSSKNVTRSDKATCFIVPASLQTNLSAAARVVDVAEVPPSIRFNSAVVDVMPSRTFISEAVDVTPSKIFNSAVVEVTPSKMFNSAVVDVTPSRMFNSETVAVKLVSFVTGRVPVIELAARSTAISVDSITSPPLALRSTERVLPDLSRPSPAVT
jgi:hypothetical protein